MAMRVHREGPTSIPTQSSILGTTSGDDEGELAGAGELQGVNGRALPLHRKDGDPREQSQGCCWEADGAHTHYGCRQTIFAFISQPTPGHVSHGAASLPALLHGPNSYIPAANGVCQPGPSARAPSHLPSPMPSCYLEMPHAHSPWEFWTGTPRMPLSCICNIKSFSPVFVVIF